MEVLLYGKSLFEMLGRRAGYVLRSNATKETKAYAAQSPKYTGTPYTTGAAPFRYRR